MASYLPSLTVPEDFTRSERNKREASLHMTLFWLKIWTLIFEVQIMGSFSNQLQCKLQIRDSYLTLISKMTNRGLLEISKKITFWTEFWSRSPWFGLFWKNGGVLYSSFCIWNFHWSLLHRSEKVRNFWKVIIRPLYPNSFSFFAD